MKQCPKCDSTCENNDVICSNCGYLFAPAGFEEQITSALNKKSYGEPQNNMQPQNDFGEPVKPQNPNYQGQVGNPNFAQQHNNSLSIAALVLGIVGVVGSCCYGIGTILGIVSLIFGIISSRHIKKSNGSEKGKGFALAGIILGVVSILILIAWIIFFLVDHQQIYQIYQNAMQNYNSSNG